MDEHRKNAYRFLLYWTLLDIRLIAWLRWSWWDPRSMRTALHRTRQAGALADAMHNLGLFASNDFDDFDEDWFWQELKDLEDRYPEFSAARYRNLFESKLQERRS